MTGIWKPSSEQWIILILLCLFYRLMIPQQAGEKHSLHLEIMPCLSLGFFLSIWKPSSEQWIILILLCLFYRLMIPQQAGEKHSLHLEIMPCLSLGFFLDI